MSAQSDPRAAEPITAERLTADLQDLGIPVGGTVMVHTSLRSLGWVVGGVQTVLAALRAAVGPFGTLVMPTQSWQLCDPAFLNETPSSWWPTIRDHLPLYDPVVTPSQTMGAVAELFRTTPGALRSPHPHRSITAVGPEASRITANHPLHEPAGDASPLGALVELDAYVLLLGVTAAKMTALHLAEHRATYPSKRTIPNGVAMLVDGERTWVTWDELDVHDRDFVDVTDAFTAETGHGQKGFVGAAHAQLLPIRSLVEYATAWFTTNRT
jgi:aminoglycoside 3-N-acetyltransferase